MPRPDLTIGPTDRVLIVGQTGSGKSTLARALFYGHRSLVVIDPKHEELLPRAGVAYTPAEFRQLWPQRTTRVVFRPNPEDARADDVDEVIRRVLAFGRTCLLLHETVDYANPNRMVPALRRAVLTGRSQHVPVVACSQRPIGLHNVVISESQHVFAFDLAMEPDRKKIAGVGGPGFLERVGEGSHEFLYHGPGTAGGVIRCPPLSAPPPQAELVMQPA